MSENLNAYKLSETETAEILGLADLALVSVEYQKSTTDDWVNDGSCLVYAGSIRDKSCFDPISSQHVNVTDFIGLTKELETDGHTRRLMLEWDDGSEEEIDLDSGHIIFDENMSLPSENYQDIVNASRSKIIQALMAMLDDAI